MPARQKVSETEFVPIVLVERYVTFRDGEERTIHAKGENIRLFGDFRLSLDIGQVVPKDVAADLRVGVEDGDPYLEPVGKAEIYLVTKHLLEANPPKTGKLVVGEKFEIRYFNGSYKLYDDGRRSDRCAKILTGEVSITSPAGTAKYEVNGRSYNTRSVHHQLPAQCRCSQAISSGRWRDRRIVGVAGVSSGFTTRVEDEMIN